MRLGVVVSPVIPQDPAVELTRSVNKLWISDFLSVPLWSGFPWLRFRLKFYQNVSSIYWHTSLIYGKGDIKTVTVFFFKLFYKFMFYVFFFLMTWALSEMYLIPAVFFQMYLFRSKLQSCSPNPLCCQEASLETDVASRARLSHRKFDA